MPGFNRSRISRAVAISLSSFALLGSFVGCNAQGSASSSNSNSAVTGSAVNLSGSVGDGPVVGATVSAYDTKKTIKNTAVSNETADYSLTVPSGTHFPVVIEATAGTDMVTGGPLDFKLQAVATSGSDQTANLNPFTTLITQIAAAMDGGLNAANLNTATQYVMERYGFGLDAGTVPDPMSTKVTPETVATIVKASESLAETIRRTRDALMVVGDTRTADDIVGTLAGDLTDGMIDGVGPNADPVVAATANVISAQVLVEELLNTLRVQGGDATSLMDAAITMAEPNATTDTSQVMITDALLHQTLVALAAAQAYSPSQALADISTSVASLSAGTTTAQAATVLPQDSTQTLQTLDSIASADAATVEAVNSKVRTTLQSDSSGSNTTGSTDTSSPSDTSGTTTDPKPTSPTTVTGDFYVAPNGSDSNSGSIDRPFHSLAKAASVAHPGDVILIRGGTYPLNQRFTVSGTSSAPITWAAYPGEKVIFDGSGKVEGVDNDHIHVQGTWNIFRGFEVRNSPAKGILVVGSHNRFENLITHHNKGTGFQIVGGNYNVAVNLVSYWNHETLKNGDNSDGFSVSSGSHNEFHNCVAYKNSDDGYDIWQSEYTLIDRGVSHDNGYDTAGNGNGFKLGSAKSSNGYHTVIYSVAYNNKANGFDWNSNYAQIKMYNNTAWHNGTTANSWPHNFNFGGGTHILRNNISLDGSVNMGPNVKDDHNSWNLGISNPKFLSLDPTSPDFLRLAPDSPAIDKGVDVGLPFKGSAPDLGAHESGS